MTDLQYWQKNKAFILGRVASGSLEFMIRLAYLEGKVDTMKEEPVVAMADFIDRTIPSITLKIPSSDNWKEKT